MLPVELLARGFYAIRIPDGAPQKKNRAHVYIQVTPMPLPDNLDKTTWMNRGLNQLTTLRERLQNIKKPHQLLIDDEASKKGQVIVVNARPIAPPTSLSDVPFEVFKRWLSTKTSAKLAQVASTFREVSNRERDAVDQINKYNFKFPLVQEQVDFIYSHLPPMKRNIREHEHTRILARTTVNGISLLIQPSEERGFFVFVALQSDKDRSMIRFVINQYGIQTFFENQPTDGYCDVRRVYGRLPRALHQIRGFPPYTMSPLLTEHPKSNTPLPYTFEKDYESALNDLLKLALVRLWQYDPSPYPSPHRRVYGDRQRY